MSAFYNENDPDAAQWLRNLMDEGLIPDGTIDTRSIADLEPGDIEGFIQVHLFAGIGGWPYALDLAGWPRDRPVWTGSCPCQPFSTAGKRRGADDERHLWPVMRDLIAERHPPVVFGEQVASKDGRVWLAGVRADLEALGYRVAAADLCAAGVGAPHIRQRLFWVAESKGAGVGRHDQNMASKAGSPRTSRDRRQDGHVAASGCTDGGLADAASQRSGGGCEDRAGEQAGVSGPGLESDDCGGVGNAKCQQCQGGHEQAYKPASGFEQAGSNGGLGHAIGARPQGHGGSGLQPSSEGREDQERHCATPGAWGDFDLVACADGVARRVESGTFPLAHGLPRSLGPGSARQQRVDLRTAKRNRRIRLRGYGNAIVPQLAAEFVAAYMISRAHPPVAHNK